MRACGAHFQFSFEAHKFSLFRIFPFSFLVFVALHFCRIKICGFSAFLSHFW